MMRSRKGEILRDLGRPGGLVELASTTDEPPRGSFQEMLDAQLHRQ
jgi:hypothetical protein